jgi:hypothetical protein
VRDGADADRVAGPGLQPHPTDAYALVPTSVVAESLLDRLIDTSHQVVVAHPAAEPAVDPGLQARPTRPLTPESR